MPKVQLQQNAEDAVFQGGQEVWVKARVLPRQDTETGKWDGLIAGPSIGLQVGSGSVNISTTETYNCSEVSDGSLVT